MALEIEQPPSDGGGVVTVPDVSVAEYQLPAGRQITVATDSAATATVEYMTADDATKYERGIGAATWAAWPLGTVSTSSSLSDVALVNLAIRVTSSGGVTTVTFGTPTPAPWQSADQSTLESVTSLVASGNLTVQGNTALGDASTDTFAAWGVSPTQQPSAWTQTYSTASKTVANPTVDALTDSTTGSAGTTLAAGVGIVSVPFNFRAAAITGNVDILAYTPGFKFKLLSMDAVCTDAVTTGAKAATLTPSIAASPVTGGVVALSGTYALAAKQAGTAVTAANTGTAAQEITVTASSVTAFTEGGFSLILRLQNMDTADAVASLAAQHTKMAADTLAMKKNDTAIIDDLQAEGWLA